MTDRRRIGILTGGGDVPGLNSCIRTFTQRALEDGCEVVGIRRGWDGLIQVRPGDPESEAAQLLPLGANQVRAVDRTGGTFLHTSRTNPMRIRRRALPAHYPAELREGDEAEKVDVTAQVLRTIEQLRLDQLVAIGGDDTLSVAVRLDSEGVPILAIPKTMDNDVHGTDYCIGFSTAVTRSVNFINDLRAPVGSNERIAVIELFGRYSGETALVSGYLASADRTLIAEVPFDVGRVAELLVQDKLANPSLYSIVVVSEGARPTDGSLVIGGEQDAFGHQKLGGIGDQLGHEIKARTGHDVLVQRLAYLMRSGPPDSLDRLVANNFGSLAYESMLEKRSGLLMAIVGGQYRTVPVSLVTAGRRQVDVAELYDSVAYRPRVTQVLGKPMFLY